MSEMIERVALAISGSDDPANILWIHRERARLALEAIRKPTINMVGAGQQVVWKGGARPGPVTVEVTTGSFAEIFTAMIDEALK